MRALQGNEPARQANASTAACSSDTGQRTRQWRRVPGPTARYATLRALLLAGALTGCAPADDAEQPDTAALPSSPAAQSPAIESTRNRNAYFGDLHVHTFYSLDAFIFGTRATPDDAYRYAKGAPLAHPAGFELQLDRPLDFQAVTDHGIFFGMLPAMADPASAVGAHPASMALRDARTVAQKRHFFLDGLTSLINSEEAAQFLDLDIVRDAWQDTIDAAERHNHPGTFTTLIGYEYTSAAAQGANLHRNVIFRGGNAPERPFSRMDSSNPEDLWDWMDGLRALGMESLAIPHNANRSNGMMFETRNRAGRSIDAVYANQRLRNEPLVEITQVKGTSATHPLLSPNDEWADFGISNQRAGASLPSDPPGSYVRDAYLRGLVMQDERGVNPYRFGLIGSSDTHNAAASYREDSYHGKLGVLDATARLRGSVPSDDPEEQAMANSPVSGRNWGASGLAGVWAEANTRDAIYDALRRKETFATSGPRIRVRFFGGTGIDASLLQADDVVAAAYANGVPMGADLPAANGAAPGFFVWAMRDATTVPLDRLQVIKGWVSEGKPFEQVYDVACSNRASVDAATNRCPDNGATVDLATCAVSENRGAAELSTVWTDPDFQPGQRAFYYARVLENPKCRWSTWDAIRAGVAPDPELPATIQDRAWSSPIWARPGG